ncbi:MAG TPA: hypothetical protein VFN42_11330 [Acetobacteraceae bacterium]|nr:hypothetical protein [Acetobacteraceae bacterium]
MPDRDPLVTDLLEMALRARKHAEAFAHHPAGQSLLKLVEELEERARQAMLEKKPEPELDR